MPHLNLVIANFEGDNQTLAEALRGMTTLLESRLHPNGAATVAPALPAPATPAPEPVAAEASEIPRKKGRPRKGGEVSDSVLQLLAKKGALGLTQIYEALAWKGTRGALNQLLGRLAKKGLLRKPSARGGTWKSA